MVYNMVAELHEGGRSVLTAPSLRTSKYLVGGAPSITGLTSRRATQQRRQGSGGRFAMDKNTINLFWANVDKKDIGECWNWLAGCSGNGYGSFRFNGRAIGAHRIAWVIANGLPLEYGYEVCHSCDNKRCCNPAHLFNGTHKDNMSDMARKGRQSCRKLSADDIAEIRMKYKRGEYGYGKLAAEYGVWRNAIVSVIKGDTGGYLES